ncbi:MAG TPA: oligosaccharide flippase family protein [Patescibacteria group bacterium]|nr:oligosaccharide flippase family protein [Patescibacteria group bacterium]
MGYTKTGLAGIGWMGSFRLFSRILAFLRIIILARLLTPFQFGVLGIATLTLSFLETITETGIGVVIIQEKENLEKYIDTAWLISILRGVLIFFIIFLSASLVSTFFNSEESVILIRLIALVALIRGFINPARSTLIKDLKFKGEFIISSIVLIVDLTFTLFFTIILKNPISLVYGLIFGAITEVVLSFLMLSLKPTLSFNKYNLKSITNRGKWVTLSSIFNFLFTDGDDALVGKLMEKSSLGIYQVAYKISTLPLTEVTNVMNTVSFPIFVKISEDRNRLLKAFSKTLIVTIMLIFPVGLIIYFFPEMIVKILLGDMWYGVIPILKSLAVFGVLRSIVIACNPLFHSLKLQKYVTLYTFTALFVMASTIYPLTINYGLNGTVYSVLLGTVASLLLNIFNIFRIFRS